MMVDQIRRIEDLDEREEIHWAAIANISKLKMDLRRKQRQTAATTVTKWLMDCEQINADKEQYFQVNNPAVAPGSSGTSAP